MISTLSQLLGNTTKTISNWKKENRPIIALLYKYFTKEELEEFLKKERITKLEIIKDFSIEELQDKLSNISNQDKRVQEIIILLNKYTEVELSQALRYCMGIYDFNNSKEYTKFTFIEKLKNLLKDANHVDELYDNKFNPLIKSLNNKLDFDFNTDDIQVLEHIMLRFKVYNTLYEINKDIKIEE